MRATYKEKTLRHHDNKEINKCINFIDSQDSQNRE